jgi:chitodextrinase
VLALLAVLAVQVSSASAVVVHLRGNKAVSYQPLRGAAASHAALRPFDALFTNLDYNGGPIMPSNTNYTIYWQPAGAPAYPSGYQTGVNRYLEDLAHDSGGHENVDSVSTQYNDAAGEFANYESHFGGTFVDKDPYPANGCSWATKCLTDEQIQTEIKKFVEHEGLPKGLATEYFLLTPPEVESCLVLPEGEACSAGSSNPYYCAYHGNIPTAGTEIIYSNDPYVSEIEGCDDGNHPNGISDGAIEGGLSHEHNESITDPEPNNAWTNFVGSEEVTGEIGDKCAGAMGTPLETPSKAKYNQVINGHFYWYQEEWSNQGHTCLQRFTFSGPADTAKFTATPGSGTEVHLDASASTASGGVFRYSWQFNDTPGGEPSSPVETTSPTLTYKFKSSGAHVVALTIYSGNGTSIGAAKTIVVGAEAPTAAFSVTSPSPTVGQPVDLDASGSSAKTGSITGYEWEFGDGSSGSGITPTHTYAAIGTHEVVLSVTDGSGLTARVAHNIVVGPASPPASPTAVTEPSSNIERTSATLHGTVNPNSSNVTDCHFEYGPTAAYGSDVSCASLPGAGSGAVGVSATVSGLSPGTTYHFRVLAANAGGTSHGLDQGFTTAAETPVSPPVTGTPSAFSPLGPSLPVCCAIVTETPTAAQVASQLEAQLAPPGKAAAIAALLRQGGLAMRFTAPVAGTATVSWYYLPRGAKLTSRSKIKPVLVASGRIVGGASASKPWSGTLRMKLTVAGRRLLKHYRRLKLTARCVFTRLGVAPIIVRATFSIKR